ncbi:MAG: hypothetical protein K2Y14_07275 [Burkholderiales bacterium]|nr:hypothetical protein [Burkholderiales bacterium]
MLNYLSNHSWASVVLGIIIFILLRAIVVFIDYLEKRKEIAIKIKFEHDFKELLDDQVIHTIVKKYFQLHVKKDTNFIRLIRINLQNGEKEFNLMCNYEQMRYIFSGCGLSVYLDYINAITLRANELGAYKFVSGADCAEVLYYSFYYFTIAEIKSEIKDRQQVSLAIEKEHKKISNIRATDILDNAKSSCINR